MRSVKYASFALIGWASAASAANICQAGKLACATTMPVGGFCECTAHGTTEEGTVVKKLPPHAKVNATAGGCGSHPGAPGCK
jgi:hypothetical protein